MEVYVDDCIFPIPKDGKQSSRFSIILDLYRDTGLTLSPGKCSFGDKVEILGLMYDLRDFPRLKISCPDDKRAKILDAIDSFLRLIAGRVDLAAESVRIVNAAQSLAGRICFIVSGTTATRTLLDPLFAVTSVTGNIKPDQLMALRRSIPVLREQFAKLQPWTIDFRFLGSENIVFSDASLEAISCLLVDQKTMKAVLTVRPVSDDMRRYAELHSPKNPIMIFEAYAFQAAVDLAKSTSPNMAACVLVDNKSVLLSWCKGHSRNNGLNDLMNQVRDAAGALPVVTRFVPSRLNLSDAWTRSVYKDKAAELEAIFRSYGFE